MSGFLERKKIMTEVQIRKTIRDYIVTTWLSGDYRDFSDDANLLQAGILDSYSTLNLAAFLDETFHTALDPAEINPENFRTVNALTRVVLAKIATDSSST
jgi:acyl carrier protein